MHLSLNNFRRLYEYSSVITYGVFFAVGAAIIFILYFNIIIMESGTIERIPDCNPGPYFDLCNKFTMHEGKDHNLIIASLYDLFTGIAISVFIATSILVIMITWFFFRGRQVKNEFMQLRFDYTNQAYYFVLSTMTHGKEEDISMDFYEIAQDVFPELKQEDVESIKKTGEEFEVDDVMLEDEKEESKKGYRFNVVAKTKAGFFLVKHFTKDRVTYEDLEDMIKKGNDYFKTWRLGVFRFVCLAKNYDDKGIKDYNKLQKTQEYKIPLDLIAVGEKGFSFVIIGIEDF